MSFRVRLMITFSLLISLTFGIGCTLLISTSFQAALEEKKETMVNEFETLQNNIAMLMQFGDTGDYRNVYELLYQMEEENIAHWQAVSVCTDKMVIYEDGDRKLLSFALPIEEDNTYAYVRVVNGKTSFLQMYSEISSGYETLYLKEVFDLSSVYELRERQQTIFWIVYAVVILFTISISGLIAHMLTKRLNTLTSTAKTIAEGNLSVRTDLKTQDEFEELSMAFDKMTDKLQNMIGQLEEDVERKEAFMGAVAHELKTPMTSIIGYADMIRQCSLSEEEQMMAANYVYQEGKRLENLSHKILDLLLMEKDTFVMKKVQMDAFLTEMMEALRPVADEKGVKLLLDCEEHVLLLEMDLAKSLFYNLVDNAIKATSGGGNVTITGRAAANGYEVQISDDGCGMDEKELHKITEAFYRVDKSRSRQQGGVGLGLTLCKKIVDLHQGTMVFQSTLGEGSKVVVFLPDREVSVYEKI
ncbi:MAG: HAMP domain-containing histidine kinase [Lachnospiraceae bacterium]|nr:HAMP domain-containing histidine kinase [Lachnospiraceae bacterium]